MSSDEEAVIVRSAISLADYDAWAALHDLEERLIGRTAQTGVGELDGNEIGEGELVLYLYGPNAENIFNAIKQILQHSYLTKFAVVVIRYGSPGAKCRVVNLAISEN